MRIEKCPISLFINGSRAIPPNSMTIVSETIPSTLRPVPQNPISANPGLIF